MEKYYEIIDADLIAKVEAWFQKRREAELAFLRLSRRVGASRNRYASGGTFGRRTFAFQFTSDPAQKLWKKDRGGQFWLPKVSSNEGRKIADEVDAIQKRDGSRSEVSKIFGVGDFFNNVGLDKVNGRWIVAFGSDWKFSTAGLKRISDVELEAMRANTKAR